ARLVYSLGRLHRSCVWEEILLQKSMPTEWEKETRIRNSGFGGIEAEDILRLRVRINDLTSSEGTEGPAVESTDTATGSNPTHENGPPSQISARFKNTRTLRYLLSKVPINIAPFFQALGKLLLFRRSLEPYQKQCANLVADQ